MPFLHLLDRVRLRIVIVLARTASSLIKEEGRQALLFVIFDFRT